MAHSRRLLVLARLDPEQKRVLGVAATANELELTTLEAVEQALAWLDRNQPHIVVVDTALPRAEKLCARVRSKKELASVPIIGIAFEINDALAPKFFGMGADDLIPPSLGAPLMARLRAVPSDQSLRPPADRGKAVVADADKLRANVFGRVLANAGYDVRFALEAVSLRFYAQQSDLKIIVANSDLGDPRNLIQESRKSGSKAVWILTAQRRDLEAMTAKLKTLDRVRVMGIGAPPENVLFTSNELLSSGDRPARATARILYGTVVAFRDAGADFDEIGFCYNVSAGGLYVRTLAPPPEDRVWLELRPPREKRRVRVEGRVAWRRSFQELAAATAPPGFGVEIVDGLGDGLTIWRRSYEEIGEAAGVRKAPPPPPVRVPIDIASEPPAVAEPPLREHVPPPLPPTVPAPREEDIVEAELLPVTEPPEPPPWPTAEEIPVIPPPPPTPTFETPAAEPALPKLPEITEPAPRPKKSSLPAKRPRSRAWLFAFIALGALIGGGIAVFMVTPTRLQSVLSGKEPAPTAPAPPPAASSAMPAATVSVSASPADAAPVDAAKPPADAAKAAAEPGGDGSELLASQGYLIVSSNEGLDVYATGVKIGPANTKNLSRCGLRFVRLGQGEPVTWRSAGQTVDVKCQTITRVTIEPLP